MTSNARQLVKLLLVVVFTVCNALDAYYTQQLVGHGLFIELNPIMNWVILNLGWTAFWSVKMFFNLVLVVLLDFVSVAALSIVTVIYLANILRTVTL